MGIWGWKHIVFTTIGVYLSYSSVYLYERQSARAVITGVFSCCDTADLLRQYRGCIVAAIINFKANLNLFDPSLTGSCSTRGISCWAMYIPSLYSCVTCYIVLPSDGPHSETASVLYLRNTYQACNDWPTVLLVVNVAGLSWNVNKVKWYYDSVIISISLHCKIDKHDIYAWWKKRFITNFENFVVCQNAVSTAESKTIKWK